MLVIILVIQLYKIIFRMIFIFIKIKTYIIIFIYNTKGVISF